MKKLVKILSLGIACLLLITSFFFIPKNKLEITSASDIIGDYNYNGEVFYDYYGFGDFAVESVDSISVQQGFALKFDLHVDSAWSYLYTFYSTTKLSSRQYFDYLMFYGSGYNILIIALDRHLYFETLRTTTINGVVYNNFNCFSDAGNIDYLMYISNCNMSVDSDLNVSFSGTTISNDYASSASDVFDMDSNTSLTLFESISSNDFLYPYLQYYVGNHSYKEIYKRLSSSTSKQSFISNNGNVVNLNFYCFESSTFRSFNSQNVFFFNDVLQFSINRPIYRTNNSLIIYNYDYLNFIKNVNYTSYTLRRVPYDYHINLDNYYFDNNKFIQVHNSELDNIIFDSYIVVSFICENIEPYYASLVYEDNIFIISHDIGFDFNFSYYTQPLVSNTSSYNYDFKKPSYKDGSIKLSIAPPKLDIPVLAWAENILIFFLFYCPVISDLIELIHFDKFFAVLLQIFDIYTSSALGDFVLGCFAFILFWNMLALIMPRFVASSKGWENAPIKDTVSAINSNIKSNKKKKETALHLRTSRNNRVRVYKHNKHDKSYMRSSSFTSFKSKNNINRYERAKHRYLRKK